MKLPFSLLLAASLSSTAFADSTPVQVTNDDTTPVPTTVTNNAAVTVTNTRDNPLPVTGQVTVGSNVSVQNAASGPLTTAAAADTNAVVYHQACTPVGSPVQEIHAVFAPPTTNLGQRFILDYVSLHVEVPTTLNAIADIAVYPQGGRLDNAPRYTVPLQSQGTFWGTTKVYNAQQSMRGVVDANNQLELFVLLSSALSAGQGAYCNATLVGHFAPAPLLIPINLGQ